MYIYIYIEREREREREREIKLDTVDERLLLCLWGLFTQSLLFR